LSHPGGRVLVIIWPLAACSKDLAAGCKVQTNKRIKTT
jgi:hypothetical protein